MKVWYAGQTFRTGWGTYSNNHRTSLALIDVEGALCAMATANVTKEPCPAGQVFINSYDDGDKNGLVAKLISAGVITEKPTAIIRHKWVSFARHHLTPEALAEIESGSNPV